MTLIAAFIAVSCTPRRPQGFESFAPSRFLAVSDATIRRAQGLVVIDATNGRISPAAVRLPSHRGLDFTGLAVDSAGDVWVALARGPACTSNVSGCGPQPHSCTGQILRVDHRTGKAATIYRASPDERIDGVAPNPGRAEVAFLSGPCDGSYFNQHIKILAEGNLREIGADVPPCHLLGVPAWLADGVHLAVVWGPPASQHSATDDGRGTCSTPQPAGVAVMDPSASVSLPNPVTVEPGCSPTAIARAAPGLAVVDVCGSTPAHLDGPVNLVVLDDFLRVTNSRRIGTCGRGSVAVAATGEIATSVYQFCNPPGTTNPHTTVAVLKHADLVPLADLPGGSLAVRDLAW